MSRKNKSKFGVGATGAVSFNVPQTSAPAPAASPPADYGPMRIAPPKSAGSPVKYLALGRVKPVQPHAAGASASMVTRSPMEVVRQSRRLDGITTSGAPTPPVTAASPAAKEASAIVSSPITAATSAAKEASAIVSSPAAYAAGQASGGGSSGGGGGGGGGGGSQDEYTPEPQTAAPAVYEETPDPHASNGVWTPPAAKAAMVAMPLPVLSTSLTPPPAPVPQKGIFARIWDFFFGGSAKSTTEPKLLGPAPQVQQLPPAKVNGEIDDAAESLVKRARYGDQNAMAIIDLVGKNAKKGVPAAVKARALMADYIQRNPVGINGELVIKHGNLTLQHGATVSGEASVKRAATHIANGATVTHQSVVGALSRFCTDPEKGAFLHGMRYPKQITPSEYGSKIELAHRAGKAMALAGKIQNVRKPGSYISAFDPVVGWELGE